MPAKLILGAQLTSTGQVSGLFDLARRLSLSLSCPTPHCQYSLGIELGDGQMAVCDTDRLVKDSLAQ